MTNTTPSPELLTLLNQYATGTLNADVLRMCLEAPRLQAALHALVGQTIPVGQGDQIMIGNLTNAQGVTAGQGAIAIGEIVLQLVRGTVVQGNQTNITGNVTGPVLSGTFSGPVNIGSSPQPAAESVKIDNQAENKGAQGVFNAPVTFHYSAQSGNPNASQPTASPTTLSLRRDTLIRRITALTEEYEAVNAQIDTTIDRAQQVRLERRAEELLSEIDKAQTELQALGG